MTIFKKHVFVCVSGKICPNQGSVEVLNELRKEVVDAGLKGQVRINQAGCMAQCGNGPMIAVYPEGVWYSRVEPADCREIVESHLLSDQPVKRLQYALLES